MDGDSILLLLCMIALTAFSAFFSATETAFSTCNHLRIKNLAQSGDKRAEKVLRLEENYDNFLTTILIMNNLVNILISTLGTLLFLRVLSDNQGLAATLSTVTVTVVLLIFGEISPKSLAKERADSFVLHTVSFVKGLVICLTPLNFIFAKWKQLLSHLNHAKEDTSITEDELITIVDEAEEDGGINADEGELIRSAIEFNDVSAGDILTPRVDVIAIRRDTPMKEIGSLYLESGYSRLPVYGEDLDDIIGILHEKDYFLASSRKESDISKYLSEPLYVSEHMKLADLLQKLKTAKCHMAIVVDEFGGTMGIVTMEDVIEELIGDVFDEHDEIIEDYTELEDGSFIVNASADLDDFFERFDLVFPTEEDMPQTVNGWIMKELETFPEVGQTFDYRNLTVEITEIGQKRVEKIHVTVRAEEEAAEPEEEQ